MNESEAKSPEKSPEKISWEEHRGDYERPRWHRYWHHHWWLCQGRHWGFYVLKVIFGLVLIGVILMIGVAIGLGAYHRSPAAYGPRYSLSGYGFNQRGIQTRGVATPMMWQFYSQTNGQTAINLAQIFGTIASVNGNQITVTTNSNQPLVILTQANTVITDANGALVPLANLKTGQNIIAVGALDKNGRMTAQAISSQ